MQNKSNRKAAMKNLVDFTMKGHPLQRKGGTGKQSIDGMKHCKSNPQVLKSMK